MWAPPGTSSSSRTMWTDTCTPRKIEVFGVSQQSNSLCLSHPCEGTNWVYILLHLLLPLLLLFLQTQSWLQVVTFFFCYKQYIANLQTEVTSSAPAPAQSSTPALVHHPQMMARSCALPQVVQAGTSPRSQLLPSNFQLLGASRGDVLGAGCPLVFSLGFKATPVEESMPYRFPPLSSQLSGQRNICYLVTDPCGGHSGILPAELAILPETLL